jgi:hypothetical protein
MLIKIAFHLYTYKHVLLLLTLYFDFACKKKKKKKTKSKINLNNTGLITTNKKKLQTRTMALNCQTKCSNSRFKKYKNFIFLWYIK